MFPVYSITYVPGLYLRGMPILGSHDVVRKARQLRAGQTEAERILWSRLRARRLAGLKFRRQ